MACRGPKPCLQYSRNHAEVGRKTQHNNNNSDQVHSCLKDKQLQENNLVTQQFKAEEIGEI